MDRIGFWNIRGMNKVRKQKEINFFMQNNEAGLFGLLETKIKNNNLVPATCSFQDWCVSTNNGYHKEGRIWILWKPRSYRVHILEYNAQFIHLKVEALMQKNTFFLTIVYAFNDIQDRAPLWSNLRRISLHTHGPWAVARDFNCVTSANERIGGNVTDAEIEPFRACIADCGLMDIYSTGSFYTWNNKQQPESRIYSRLDKFMINKEWSDLLQGAYAHFHPEGLYDHTPCIVSFTLHSPRRHSFKYLNMWGKSDKFCPLIRRCWNKEIHGYPMFGLVTNLKKLKLGLKEINKDQFSDIELRTSLLELKVKKL
ncbi:hypothetical protein vseg_003502 [Gypsophila vaccaria]